MSITLFTLGSITVGMLVLACPKQNKQASMCAMSSKTQANKRYHQTSDDGGSSSFENIDD